jgi:chemosensory pili system protein ChpA (sensor histidine kinase/response regulator)
VELPDRDFLRRVFLMEAWETLASLEDAMQRITDVPGDADETLTLVTHRLKGAAALNGFATLAEVAGQAEEMVERLPGAPLDERRRTIEFMRAFVAALRPALDRIEATGREDADALAALLPPPATADGSDARSELVAPAPQPLAEMERFLAENPEVLEYFGPEAAEHLETISRTLTSLEQQPTEDEMKTLFRAVHTLKGAAYTVGCNVVGDLAHRIEDLLGAIRDGRAALTPDVFETVWIGHDALKVLLAGGQAPPNGNDVVARAVERLMGGGQAAGIPPAAPASVAAIPAISARPLGAPARAA